MAGRRWTPAEEDLLRDCYGEMSIETIARKLDRTPYGVYNRAGKLALGPNRPHDVLTLFHVLEIIGQEGRHTRFSAPGYGLIARGMLKATRGKSYYKKRSQEWWIKEKDLIEFLKSYPQCVDRDKVQPPYRQYVSDRYIGLHEAFQRGAAHPVLLEYAIKAGCLPEARNNGVPGSRWSIPESILPRLIEGRRRFVSDIDHRRIWTRYEQNRHRSNMKQRRSKFAREYALIAQRAS